MEKNIEYVMKDIRRHEERLEDDKRRLQEKAEDMGRELGREGMWMESVIAEAQSIIRAATAIDKSMEALRSKKEIMKFLHAQE